MASIAKLAVELALKHGRFDAGLSESGKGVKGFKGKVEASSKALGGMAKTMLAMASTGAIAMFIRSNMQSIDTLAKTSDKLGIATEKLQAYRLAAEQMAGVGNQQFDTALQRMTRRLGEAENGTGEAIKALDALGISIDEIRGRSPDEQMRIIADAMQDVEGQSQKLAIAFKLFDAEGAALVNMLKDGSAGLDEMEEKARKLGLTMTRDQAAKVEEANDAWSDFNANMEGVAQTLTVQLAPTIKDIAELLGDVNEALHANETLAKSIAGLKGGDQALADTVEQQLRFANNQDRLEAVNNLQKEIEKANKSGNTEALTEALKKRDFLISDLVTALNEQDAADGELGNLFVDLEKTISHVGVMADGYREKIRDIKTETTGWGEVVQALGVDLRTFSEDTTEMNRVTVGQNARVTESTALYGHLSEVIKALRGEQNKLREDMAMAAVDVPDAEFQFLQDRQARELELIETHNANKLESETNLDNSLRQMWDASWTAKAQITADAFSGLSTLMQSESRTLFEIGKGAAYAETVFSTYAAAQKQFEFFSRINPALAYTAAAGAVASGLMRAAAIKNTSFGGGAAKTAALSTQTSIASGDVQGSTGPDSGGGGGISQELVIMGSSVDVESLEATYRDAREQNINITGVRRG